MKKVLKLNSTIALAVGAFLSTAAMANDTPIVGNVESKCSIFTDKEGVYGNPTPDKLSTATSDGGVVPVIRYDVIQGGYYDAKIAYPDSFSSSPSLADSVTWTGATTVSTVSDTAMSDYETNKVEYNNVTEFDLHTAGTVWFNVTSTAEYGVGKSFPAGSYTALVTAECIAK